MKLLLACATIAFAPGSAVAHDGAKPWFGHVAAGAGDVDGDGVADWAVGFGENNCVRVLSGKDARELLVVAQVLDGGSVRDRVESLGDVDGDHRSDILLSASTLCTSTARAIGGKNGQLLFEVPGACATVVGDVNGDRIADIVLGVLDEKAPAKARTVTIHVRSGADGAPLAQWAEELGPVPSTFMLCAAGDVDADGIPDFCALVGKGAMVLSGKDHSRLHLFAEKRGRNPRTVAGVAHFDGDKHADVLVGYPNEEDEDAGKGFVVAYSGADGRELGTAEATGGWFGFAIRVLGDADGDGTPDFVAGSHGESFVDPIRLISGKTWRELWKINADFDGDCHREPALAAIPDADGDGVTDLLVGAAAYPGRCEKVGYVLIVSGKTGKMLRRIDLGDAGKTVKDSNPR